MAKKLQKSTDLRSCPSCRREWFDREGGLFLTCPHCRQYSDGRTEDELRRSVRDAMAEAKALDKARKYIVGEFR